MSSEMKRIIEGLLFAADAPLSLSQLMRVLENGDRGLVREQVEELIQEYQELDRAFVLVEVAGGYRLRTRPELSPWLRRLRSQQVTRLSRAALESLAIIAYKQPVLRAEIERVRGVDVGGVLRLLMGKDLVRVLGRQDLPGKPLIYGTTKRFLEVFDLKNLKDLPSIEEMAALAGEAPDEEPRSLFDAAPNTKDPAGPGLYPPGPEGEEPVGADPDSAAQEEAGPQTAPNAEEPDRPGGSPPRDDPPAA